MNLEYVPLLQIQREIQGMPRDRNRFKHYLRVIGTQGNPGGNGPQLELPTLLAMNPMGKEHVTRQLDALLAMDADRIAADAVREAAAQVAEEGEYKIGLVIADDFGGGWTNRYDYEFTFRFPAGATESETTKGLPRWLKHYWIHSLLWSSEPPTAKAVRESILTAIYRTAYRIKNGCPRTLGDMMIQEGAVLTRAGCTEPVLPEADLTDTRAILEPFLDAGDKRTVIECLFGDDASATLGFTPRGLRPWAGLALALRDAQRRVSSCWGARI